MLDHTIDVLEDLAPLIFERIGDRLGNVTDGKNGGRCSRSGGEHMLVKLNLPHPGASPCFSREFVLQTASRPGRRHRSSSEMLLGTIEPGVYPRSGSDITRVPATCSYRQVVTHFTEELDFLSAADLEWIMGRGLVECLRWPV